MVKLGLLALMLKTNLCPTRGSSVSTAEMVWISCRKGEKKIILFLIQLEYLTGDFPSGCFIRPQILFAPCLIYPRHTDELFVLLHYE